MGKYHISNPEAVKKYVLSQRGDWEKVKHILETTGVSVKQALKKSKEKIVAKKPSLTYYVEDDKGKEVGISGEEYWKEIKAKEEAKAAEKVRVGAANIAKLAAERARIAAEAVISSAKITARNKKVREAIAATEAAAKRWIEKKKAGTSWLPGKDTEVKAQIKADVKKYGYGGIPKERPPVIPKYTSGVSLLSPQAARDYVPKPIISLRLIIVGIVGIGAATLYYMRRKKR